MRLDQATLVSVASVVAWVSLLACRPTFQAPDAPGEGPSDTPVARRLHANPGGHGAMLGELCPDGGDGRPALAPLAVRTVSWSTDRGDLDAALARGQAAQFAVLAIDGQRIGRFSVIGADDGPVQLAVGSYVGGSPCNRGGAVDGKLDDTCVQLRRGCGLGVAALVASGGMLEDEDPPVLDIGGACRAGDDLAIDIDRDGSPERFPLRGFLDELRAPAEEVTAAAAVAATCRPVFSLIGLTMPVDPGAEPPDPRARVDVDVLGVLDVDGDGRREVVIGLRYAERRSIAVYSAVTSSARLELVGELEPWTP